MGGHHRTDSDDRFPGTARQHNHTRTSRREQVDGVLLIPAHVPTVGDEFDVELLPFGESRSVFRRPTEPEKFLLDNSACPIVEPNSRLADRFAQQGLEL